MTAFDAVALTGHQREVAQTGHLLDSNVIRASRHSEATFLVGDTPEICALPQNSRPVAARPTVDGRAVTPPSCWLSEPRGQVDTLQRWTWPWSIQNRWSAWSVDVSYRFGKSGWCAEDRHFGGCGCRRPLHSAWCGMAGPWRTMATGTARTLATPIRWLGGGRVRWGALRVRQGGARVRRRWWPRANNLAPSTINIITYNYLDWVLYLVRSIIII